ncbi:MAG: hypothetical protein CMI16_15210 [Opitutaceae bacterium]|nr:hypothetical protein [Opitutaceae bacterium]
MSPEKLSQLRRQRELVQQHLDWLDAEIVTHSEGQSIPLEREEPLAAALDPVDPARAENTGSVMQPNPLKSSTEAKRGCLILFFIVIGILAATLVGIYFWKYRDRPLLFPEKAADASYSRSITG